MGRVTEWVAVASECCQEGPINRHDWARHQPILPKMKSSFAFVASLAGLVSFAAAEVGIYGQCGGRYLLQLHITPRWSDLRFPFAAGLDYKGDTLCIRGTTCTVGPYLRGNSPRNNI